MASDGAHGPPGGKGPSTLCCAEARVLLMGYLDGELEAAEANRLQDHLAVCVGCRREEQAYRRLGKVTEDMLDDSEHVDVEAAWTGIYAKIERRVGWILLSVGLILLMGLFGWELLDGFFMNPDEPLGVRVGLGALLGGLIVLVVSFGRERLYHRKTERYTEVQR